MLQDEMIRKKTVWTSMIVPTLRAEGRWEPQVIA
jgi:hypothetical protein